MAGDSATASDAHESTPTRLSDRVREKVADADSTASFAASMRRRRWQRFIELFPDLRDMRVLDLGGTASSWTSAPTRPAAVVMVNLFEQSCDEPWITSVVGDVCRLPASLDSERFDVVYSNSVIEHIGGHTRRVEMIEVVHQMSDRHWIQTPYRYFPLEPHWLFPGMQFLPTAVRARIAMKWPLAWGRAADLRAGVNGAMSVELLDRTQMKFYFPESQLLTERVLGLPKSLIAAR